MQNVAAKKILLNSCFENVKQLKKQLNACKKQGFVQRINAYRQAIQKEQDLINDLLA